MEKENKMYKKYHTAAHLLHESLCRILRNSIVHKWVNITIDRLRFDFTSQNPLNDQEIQKVEDMVNKQIAAKIPVKIVTVSLQEAQALNARLLSNTNPVKLCTIGTFSIEACSGEHVENTRELGYFKIIKQESTPSGVHKIYAVLNDK